MSDDVDYWKAEKDLVEAMSPRFGAIVKYVSAFRERAERNAEKVLDEAAAAAEVDVEELLQQISEDEHLLVLLASTVEAAQRATSEHKVQALGQALAVGVLQEDDAAIDEAQMLVATLRDLEAPHIRALAQIASLNESMLALTFSDIVLPQDRWPPDDLRDHVAAPILAVLVRHGLVQAYEADVASVSRLGQSHYATRYGHRLLGVLREAGDGAAR